MRRSMMPVRSRIHSSEVSTIRSKSWFVSRPSGTYMPVPAMVAPRISGRGVTIRLDFFPNVLVHALLHERGHGVNRAPDGALRAAPVPDEAHAIHPEQGRRGMLFPVDLLHHAAQGRLHQDRAEHRHRVALHL